MYVLLIIFPLGYLLLHRLVWMLMFAATPWRGFKTGTKPHRMQRYTTLHLSGYDRVGHLNLRQAARFHQSFLTVLQQALQTRSSPLYFRSHLMRPAHRKSLTKLMASMAGTHRWRSTPVTLSAFERHGIRVQIFLSEWRWITVPETGVLVLIRPRRKAP